MEKYYSTKEVAKLLKIKTDTLSKAIWQGRIEQSAKSPSNSFLWTIADIEKAAWALHCFGRFNNFLKEKQMETGIKKACCVNNGQAKQTAKKIILSSQQAVNTERANRGKLIDPAKSK